MVSAQAAVLGDDNLLTIIAPHLPRSAIVALPLTSRYFNKQFSPYLFRVLRVRFSSWYLLRLQWVARKAFRRGVRELVWDAVTYVNCDNVEMETLAAKRREVSELASVSLRAAGLLDTAGLRLGALMGRHRAAAIDEMQTIAACFNDYRKIDHALQRLKWCHKVTITTWSGGDMFSRAALLGEGNAMPPPLATFTPRIGICRNQSLARGMLMPDLGAPPMKLKELNVCNIDDRALVPKPSAIRLPAVSVNWQSVNALTAPYIASNIVRMCLQFTCDEALAMNDLDNAASSAGFADLWFSVPNLRSLDLEFRVRVIPVDGANELASVLSLKELFTTTVFGHLTMLTLRSFWLEPDDLARFLKRHASTLQHLTLSDINLGGTTGLFDQAVPNKKWLVMRPVLLPNRFKIWPDFRDFFDCFDSDISLPECSLPWIEVMQACQDMASLRGLSLLRPTLGVACDTLYEYQVADLVEIGMNGRENGLKVPHWSNSWE